MPDQHCLLGSNKLGTAAFKECATLGILFTGFDQMVPTAALTECETTVMCQQSLARVMKD
jgi:hypothetical protein